MGDKRAHKCVRTCIICGYKRDKNNLLRLGIQGKKVVLDRGKRMIGRGAYICPTTKCIERARGNYRNCLGRAFKGRPFEKIEI